MKEKRPFETESSQTQILASDGDVHTNSLSHSGLQTTATINQLDWIG